MKGIQERRNLGGGISFRAQVRLKGAQPITATFRRKTDAVRWKQQTEVDIRSLRYFPLVEAKKRTVGELIDRYIDETFEQRRSRQTPLQTLDWWKSKVGYLTLDRLTTAVIKGHWDSLAVGPSERTGRPLSPRMLNCYLETFSAALTKASREYGWLPENPALRIQRKKLPPGRVRCLDEVELPKFLEQVYTAKNPYLRPAVLLSLATGGRRSEVLGLTWEDVDLKNGSVTFRHTKNGDTRSVPLRGEALDCLKEHARTYRFRSEQVFPARKYRWKQGQGRTSTPWEDPRAAFRDACKKAGIVNFRWHDMRHCAASYLLASGASLGEVGKVLGHRGPQMTWRYTHLVQGRTDELVTKMADNFLQRHA